MIGLGPATISNPGGPLATLPSGAGDTILEMNPGDTAPTYYPVTGDASCSGGVFTIKGISGSTPIPLTPNEFQWVTGAAPKFSQAIALAGIVPAATHIATQLPNAASTTNPTNTGGSLLVDLPAPNANTVAGSEAWFQVTRGGVLVASLGLSSGALQALFLGSGAPSTTNYSIVNNGGFTVLNAPSGTIRFAFGSVQSYDFSNSVATFFNGTTAISGGGAKVIGLANATTDPTSKPTGGGVLWERGDGSGLAHFGSGGFVVDLAPSGTGTQNTQAMAERERKFVASSTSTTAAAAGSLNLNAYRGKQISIQLMQQSRDVTTPSTANMGSIITQLLVANVAGVVSVVGSSNVVGSNLGAALAAVTFDVSVTDVLTFKIANAAGGLSTDTWDWTLHALLDAN